MVGIDDADIPRLESEIAYLLSGFGKTYQVIKDEGMGFVTAKNETTKLLLTTYKA